MAPWLSMRIFDVQKLVTMEFSMVVVDLVWLG